MMKAKLKEGIFCEKSECGEAVAFVTYEAVEVDHPAEIEGEKAKPGVKIKKHEPVVLEAITVESFEKIFEEA